MLGSDRLIPLAEVMRIVGLGRTAIYGMIRDGQFPKQVKPRPRASRWIEREVMEWINACGDERKL